MAHGGRDVRHRDVLQSHGRSRGYDNPLQKTASPSITTRPAGMRCSCSGNSGSQTPGDPIYDGTGEWVVDPDAGVVTFYNYDGVKGFVDESKPPLCRFSGTRGRSGCPSRRPGPPPRTGSATTRPTKPSSSAGIRRRPRRWGWRSAGTPKCTAP